MEPDPLVNLPVGKPSPVAKKTNKSNPNSNVQLKRPSYHNIDVGNSGGGSATFMNLVFCVLCAMCFSSSVYFGYREMTMEGRLEALEMEMSLLKKSSIEPGDVLVERIRRQVEEHFQRRVSRDVALHTGFLREANEPHTRTAREAPECVCPPGKFTANIAHTDFLKSITASTSTI